MKKTLSLLTALCLVLGVLAGGMAYAEDVVKRLPPIQPKRGKWIYKTDLITVPTGYWECSECKEGRLLYEANFCPNCGAEMKVTK